jgi:NAD(P)-dependent dehydrogenase (short-subunit alcohol dehydrogenase family)
MTRLLGKRAIITGAGSGIGRASAMRFAKEGAQVLVTGRTLAKVEETAHMIREAGGIAIAMAADASKEADVEMIVARCVTDFGGLEVFFANAATWIGNVPLFDQTVEQWEDVLRINLISTFLATKHAGRHMRSKGIGSIIFTSSIASLRAKPA